MPEFEWVISCADGLSPLFERRLPAVALNESSAKILLRHLAARDLDFDEVVDSCIRKKAGGYRSRLEVILNPWERKPHIADDERHSTLHRNQGNQGCAKGARGVRHSSHVIAIALKAIWTMTGDEPGGREDTPRQCVDRPLARPRIMAAPSDRSLPELCPSSCAKTALVMFLCSVERGRFSAPA